MVMRTCTPGWLGKEQFCKVGQPSFCYASTCCLWGAVVADKCYHW